MDQDSLGLLGPLRAVVVTLAVRDKALADDMDFEAYIRTRDPALVKCKEGMQPTWFVLSPLKAEWVAEKVDSWSSDSQRFASSFLGACHVIEPGEGGEPKRAPTRMAAYNQRVADVAWMGAAAKKYGLLAVYELGSLAWQRTQLPEGSQGPFSL